MKKQGGAQKTEKQEAVAKGSTFEGINQKTLLFVIAGILFGAIFVLILIYFGMQMAKVDILGEAADQKAATTGTVISVIPVTTTVSTYTYAPAATQLATGDFKSGLFQNAGCGKENYAVIKSRDELDDLVQALKSENITSGSLDSIDTDDSFFVSGSILAIDYEAKGLSALATDGIVRDSNYDLTLTLVGSVDESSNVVTGHLALFKIANIQPTNVTLDYSDNTTSK